ncbi:MAG TPA: DUF1800 domain-containing protein [Phycisphaerales bacterium]|nr:DUF1800 domain-containing protein [Phycisphaerales bacterium]
MLQPEPATKPDAAANRPTPVDDQSIEKSLRPLDPKRFGYAQARHLLWRAGFGGTEQQVQTLVSWGPAKSVEHLINYDKVPGEPVKEDAFDKDIMRPPTEEERRAQAAARRSQNQEEISRLQRLRQDRARTDRGQMGDIQKWWLKRMIETARPLEEKLTLFWHGHFATSFRSVEDSYHMFVQNQLFRTHAAGNFGELLKAIIRDPAMIKFLNNNDNRKGRPNENLAREIMELFSLGLGNYTEKDIKEGARALTGYTYRDDQFVFERNQHDNGGKTILGQGNLNDGDDFVKAILAQRACSQYIARRMYHYFVSDVPPDERGGDKELHPAQRAAIRELGTTLQSNRYEVKPVLKKLFLSEHFYEPRFMNEQIKSPVQLVVGAVRSLNTPVRDLSILNDALDLMGQRLFMPPSVKGWDGGRSWINTSTMFVRQNIMTFLITGKKPVGYDGSAGTDVFDAMAVLPRSVHGKDEVVDGVLDVTLGQRPLSARQAMLDYLDEKDGEINNATVTGLILLATAMPEYQLC